MFYRSENEVETKKSYEYKLRSPFYVEKGVGGGPKSKNPMKTRTSLLKYRRDR